MVRLSITEMDKELLDAKLLPVEKDPSDSYFSSFVYVPRPKNDIRAKVKQLLTYIC